MIFLFNFQKPIMQDPRHAEQMKISSSQRNGLLIFDTKNKTVKGLPDCWLIWASCSWQHRRQRQQRN